LLRLCPPPARLAATQLGLAAATLHFPSLHQLAAGQAALLASEGAGAGVHVAPLGALYPICDVVPPHCAGSSGGGGGDGGSAAVGGQVPSTGEVAADVVFGEGVVVPGAGR
jgi:hypothetical protein